MSDTMDTARVDSRSSDTVIEIANANVTFEMARGRACALDDVSVTIERGETFGIIGESGCGKSMFAASILDDVEDPGQLSGRVTYYPPDGEPIEILDLDDRQRRQVLWDDIAIVFQGAMNALNPTQNVRMHFKETLAAHDEDRREGMERARDLLERVNLDPGHVMDAYQHELSGGEKQRVLLALSLLLDPEVLIMDEPTAALDLLMQRKILSLLYDIEKEFDLTLVLISHDIPVLSGFADRIAVMYAFQFVERGDVRDVLLDSQHPYTRMLLRTMISIDTPIEDIESISGETPDPINVPAGCPFHPRCPVADDRCSEEEPALQAPADGTHEAACFYPDTAIENIPVSIAREDDR